MRLLVFEFITGGGFINESLPEALLQEGHLMRNALLNDLCELNRVELIVLCDQRVEFLIGDNRGNITVLTIKLGENVQEILLKNSSLYDAVWLIAPESEGILALWAQFFHQQKKQVCLSGQQAITLCQDKLATFNCLNDAGITCVNSQLFSAGNEPLHGEWVLKANNSVGCDEVYLLQEQQNWQTVLPALSIDKSYILQPYILGKVLSLSCLFYRQKAYLICCNEQHITINQLQFSLSACTVNVQDDKFHPYQQLCQKIADAIPQLFGYVGVDFIETEGGEPLILEINPRLTTSYVGIKEALGLNIGSIVLAMLDNKKPILNKIINQAVLVEINKENIVDSNFIGWDIGGAHLKAAFLNQDAQVQVVYQEPCPLWQGIEELERAALKILAKLPKSHLKHAITMTGELVDLFVDRSQGVFEIIDLMQAILQQESLAIYAGRLGFIFSDRVEKQHIDDIASANWLVSASYVAQKLEQGLFVDIGSTTSDILLFNNNRVDALGYTDFHRLASSELVYTGIIRTAVMAEVQTVHFSGHDVGVMSEYFATMADVYRLTGELDEQHDQANTADGEIKSEQASARRIARMIGCDFQDFSLLEWQQLAHNIREQQLVRLQESCAKQLVRLEGVGKITLVGAGVGRFLVREIAQRLNLDYVDFAGLFTGPSNVDGMSIADCAPAVAVADLAISSKFC